MDILEIVIKQNLGLRLTKEEKIALSTYDKTDIKTITDWIHHPENQEWLEELIEKIQLQPNKEEKLTKKLKYLDKNQQILIKKEII